MEQDWSGLSVVIPFHSSQSDLRASLQALERSFTALPPEKQDNIEVIVVNDASPIEPYLSPTLPQHTLSFTHNKGVSAARNAGIKLARHERFFCLDSDVLVREDFFQALPTLFKKHQAAPVVQGFVSGHSPAQKPSLFSQFMHLTNASDALTYQGHLLCTGCFSSTKSFFEEVGYFDTRFDKSGGEEYEILNRFPSLSIEQSELVVDHECETFVSRIRKIWHRSRHYSQVAAFNPHFPLRLKRVGLLKVLFSGTLTLAFLTVWFSPSLALALSVVSVLGFIFADGGVQMSYIYKNGGWTLALVSPAFIFVEYFTAALGAAYHGVAGFLQRRIHAR